MYEDLKTVKNLLNYDDLRKLYLQYNLKWVSLIIHEESLRNILSFRNGKRKKMLDLVLSARKVCVFFLPTLYQHELPLIPQVCITLETSLHLT